MISEIVFCVATVLTVYGIETIDKIAATVHEQWSSVATVLTVHGIETFSCDRLNVCKDIVATVLTVHGMRRRVRDSRGAKRR